MTKKERNELIRRAKHISTTRGELGHSGKLFIWKHHDLRIFWVPLANDLRLKAGRDSVVTINHGGWRFHDDERAAEFLELLRNLMILDDLAEI